MTIVDVHSDRIIMDGNHPLAGKTLNFDITVHEVREPRREELVSDCCRAGTCSS